MAKKQNLSTTFVITVEHDKPIADLIDLVAGRAYTLDGVTNATASLEAPQVENPWRDAVIDGLIVSHMYCREHDGDARLALRDLLRAEIDIALEPAVSSRAQALIDRGRASSICARFVDFIRAVWAHVWATVGPKKAPTDWSV